MCFRHLRQRCFAGMYDVVMRGYERYIEARKRELFIELPKNIVEIGPGTGANLAYLPAGTNWIGVEPNPHMHRRIEATARKLDITIEIVSSSADQTGLAAASADAVLCTLVLCSVTDAQATLAEAKRILRPGGRFLFIEHIAAPTGSWLRRAQSLANPAWSILADGCRLNRDTVTELESADFSELNIDHFRVPTPPALPIISPHIAGVGIV